MSTYSIASEPPPPPPPPRRRPAVPAGARRAPALSRQPLWPTAEEVTGRHWLAVMVFLAIIGLYAWGLSFFYAGAHPGVDQNGYLMTARLITGERDVYAPEAPVVSSAANGNAATAPAGADKDFPAPSAIQQNPLFDGLRNRLSFIPETPFQFAGRMDVITEPFGPPVVDKPANYRVYAKYPFGFPLLAAIGRWMGGVDGMYVVNPLCTVLACFFAYFLFRQAVTPFMSLLGVIWLACNPLVLFYANDANSHASTLFCVTVGFWGVVSWLRTGGNWRAWIGGFALGYACTIRYSEFLLVLPVLFAAVLNFRWEWKRAWGSMSLLLAWAIPIAVLAGVCWVSFGEPWKTGYTYCRESTGFAWKYLSGDFGDATKQGNWETLLTQLNYTGLFVLWPLAVAGLFAMLGSAWRLGGLLALWVLPSTLLYLLYYWAPTGTTTMGYLRFFMSIIPGLIFCGLWFLERGLVVLRGERRASLAAITLFGIFGLVCAAMYYENDTVQVGLAFFPQVFHAVVDFARGSYVGMGATVFVGLVLLGIWYFDHWHAEAVTGMALGAGVLTAIGCGFSLYRILPQVEANYVQYVGVRQIVDNVRERVPPGSVIFSDDRTLNQLDAVGGWKLINDMLFSPVAFYDSKKRVESFDKDTDKQEDPDPIQIDRSRYYEELLGKKDAKGNWVAKSPAELRQLKMELIERNLDQGRRVMFVRQEYPAGAAARPWGGRVEVPATGGGYVAKVIGRWDVATAQATGTMQNVLRRQRAGVAPKPVVEAPPAKHGTIYYLWEIVKAPEKGAKKESPATATRVGR